jgi:hypothetical protein
MRTREGEIWEAKSFMNGERIIVVIKSRISRDQNCVVHSVFHITGSKNTRVLEWAERDEEWERSSTMKRLA